MTEFIRLQGASSDSIDTHRTTYFKKVWRDLGIHHESVIVDPFARDCPLGGIWTNDIDPATSARFHVDALVFIQEVPVMADVVIFDPPFSASQAERKYGSRNIYADGKYFSQLAKECVDILHPGGRLLKFGYNSTRHDPRLKLEKGWVANMGGNRNDVIITSWVKVNTTLDQFTSNLPIDVEN